MSERAPSERSLRGTAEALVAACLWGSSGVFAVHLFRLGVPPETIALVRPIIGVAILAAGFLSVRPALLRVSRRGLAFLGFPLHPPGKPEQLRVAHLGAIRVPMLVVQGERDPFGSPDEIRREFTAAGAQPQVIEVPAGGHGFEVRAKDGRQADVYARVADSVTQWLDTLPPTAL